MTAATPSRALTARTRCLGRPRAAQLTQRYHTAQRPRAAGAFLHAGVCFHVWQNGQPTEGAGCVRKCAP